jgi:hypothetical protein
LGSESYGGKRSSAKGWGFINSPKNSAGRGAVVHRPGKGRISLALAFQELDKTKGRLTFLLEVLNRF